MNMHFILHKDTQNIFKMLWYTYLHRNFWFYKALQQFTIPNSEQILAEIKNNF